MQTELGKLRTHARYTALHRFARDGDTRTVIELLHGGEEKDAIDAFGETPLMHAAGGGHVSVVCTLLRKYPDLTVRNVSTGATAVHLAAKAGHYRVVEALRWGGADMNAVDDNGETPLFDAVNYRHLHVVRLLLATGADANTRSNSSSRAALHCAAILGRDGMVGALKDGGADLDALDGNSETPLVVAS